MATSEVVEPVGAPRALIYTRVSEDKRRGVADFPSVEVVMTMDKPVSRGWPFSGGFAMNSITHRA